MAGITDSPYRRMARRAGAGLLYSEVVSAEGLRRQGRGSFDLCRFEPEERPIAIQLFGSNVEAFAEAAELVAKNFAPDMIDINCGCPVKKFVTRGCGGALMQFPDLIGRIVDAVGVASGLPVSVKLRSGYFPGEETAPQAAIAARDSGAVLVAIHSRYVRKAKGTAADWNVIRRVKEAVPELPVIGNGDIFSVENARQMLEFTGCDRVMIARWAEGRPWLFEALKNEDFSADIPEEPSISAKIALILEQVGMMVGFYGERTAVFRMRKQLGWYSHGWPGGSKLRGDLMRISSAAGVIERLMQYEASLTQESLEAYDRARKGSPVVFMEE